MSFAIQFHATLDELTDYVITWMARYTMHALATVYRPFSVHEIDRNSIAEVLANERVCRLMFTQQTPEYHNATGNNDLLDHNPSPLLLDVGRIGIKGLEESRLSAKGVVPKWRAISEDLKKSTRSGAHGINENSGARAFYKQHRYTAGAKALAEQGIPMRPFAQSPVRFFFSD